MVIYEDDDVYIGTDAVRFGGRPLPTRIPNAGRGLFLPGLHWIEARRAGLLSTQYHIVLTYYDGSPDRIIWVAHGGARADAIVEALRELLL